MRLKTIALVCLLALSFVLSSCANPIPAETSVSLSETISEETSTASEAVTVSTTLSSSTRGSTAPVTMTTLKSPKKGGHKFKKHVLSDIYKKAYGPGFEEDFFSYCDAVLNIKDSVRLKDRANYIRCRRAIKTCLPVADIYVSNFDSDEEEKKTDEADNKNGTYKLEYSVPKAEIPALINDFKARVKKLIDSCCTQNDTPLEKALALYMEESTRLSYDFSSEENPTRKLSVYSALMGDCAICQEIAGAYAYLLLQVGIDATTCSAIDHGGNYGHEWTVVKLGDRYYHCDVTSQTQEKLSLRYFGMNDAKRESEGDYDPSSFNFATINEIYHDDFPIDDKTFEPLWKARFYMIDRKNDVLYCFENTNNEGEPYLKLPLK